MNKIFHISNRNSGKTSLAVYEFLKDPENSLLINSSEQSYESIKKTGILDEKYLENFILKTPDINSVNYKRIIFDDYLFLTVDLREYYSKKFDNEKIKEIICFSTPKILYSKKMYNFVKEIKIESKNLDLKDWLDKNELLLEINDPSIKTKYEVKRELYDLYFNYLTDPDTVIIKHDFFNNKKLLKLENVSYYPDLYREYTDLKGEFLKED